MKSLADLNTESVTQIDFDDDRDPRPIFNKPFANNVDEELSFSFEYVVQPTIEIVDIIRPLDAQIVYEINVSGIPGTIVTWDNIPPTCTLTVSGGIYSISGITSVSIWNAIKSPTINVPLDFQGSFFYNVSIKWQGILGEQSKSWQVGYFIPVSAIDFTTSFSVQADKIHGTSSNFVVNTNLSATIEDAQLFSTFAWNIFTENISRRSATLTSNFSLINYGITGINDLTYNSNVENLLFSTFEINEKITDLTSNHSITITFDSGYVGPETTSVIISNITVTGNKTEVENQIRQLKYWPDYNYTGPVVMEIVHYKNSNLVDSFKKIVSFNTAGTYQNYYTITSSTNNFRFKVAEYLYCKISEICVVGGGGGGAYASGGGGGGVSFGYNLNIPSVGNNVIQVGAGGNGNSNQQNCGPTFRGGTGGNSSAFSISSFGGQGGYEQYCYDGSTTTYNRSGGNSGSPTSHLGGQYSGTIGGQFAASQAGGGGGAGTNGSIENGGAGISAGNFGTFGGGGGGEGGVGGSGGGGNGGFPSGTPGVNGTGGGGGNRAKGGSGAVYLRINLK